MSEDDQRAFREAMNGVRPLPPYERVPARPAPGAVARPARAAAGQVLRESLLPPEDPAVLDSGAELSFRRAGVRHLATFGKTKKQKVGLRGTGHLAEPDAKKIKETLPYSR